MSDLNRWTGTGNVGGEPEFKDVNGTDLATFSMAVSNYMGKDREDEVMWIDCNLWGARSNVASYIETGMKLTVSGKLKIRKFQDDNDNWKVFVNIDVDDLILPSRGGAGGGGKKSSPSRGGGKSKSSGKKKSRGRKSPF